MTGVQTCALPIWGDTDEAASHLRTFLTRPPKGSDAERWIKHAEGTLREIESGAHSEAP